MTISELHQLFLQYPTIYTDSRRVANDGLFFALKGEKFDANDFALSALDNGVPYVIVDNPAVVSSERFILVENVLRTLQDLAKYHREYCKTPIIAVTGTNGKTTTKELINSVLKSNYITLATDGNYNNHIGVPLTLLKLTEETEIGIVEMGASHIGEINFLCEIAQPNYGVITNIGIGHIEGFGSFEGVIQTKMELYKYIERTRGTIFINADDELLSEKIEEIDCPVFSYGMKDAQVEGEFISAIPFLYFKIGELLIETHLVGSYNFENAMAAVAVGKYLNISLPLIAEAIRAYEPNNDRSEWIEKEETKNAITLDCYNANLSSMSKAIEDFACQRYENKLLILGDMLELGYLSEQAHRDIKSLLIKYHLDSNTVLVGKLFSKTKNDEGFIYFETTEPLIEMIKEKPITHSHILIKGSRGIHLEDILPFL